MVSYEIKFLNLHLIWGFSRAKTIMIALLVILGVLIYIYYNQLVSLIAFIIAIMGPFTKVQDDREQKRELARKLLSPFIDKLGINIKQLGDHTYRWSHIQKEPKNLFKLEVGYGKDYEVLLLKNLKKEHPEAGSDIEQHNKKYYELVGKLTELDDTMYKTGFEDSAKELADKFDRKNLDQIPKKGTYHDFDYLAGQVMDNIKKLDKTYVDADFWNYNGKELLKFRDRDYVKKQLEETTKLADELGEIAEKTKNHLERIREDYMDRYKFTVEDMQSEVPIDQLLW